MKLHSEQRVEEEALRWVVRMHSDQVTIDDETEFTAWLAASLNHRAAYDRQIAIWTGASSLRDNPEAMASMSMLRTAVENRDGIGRRAMLAAVAVALASGGWFMWDVLLRGERYKTTVGEQRRIILEDRSAITLNTDSVLRVRFEDGERRIWLDRGQAFFAVASDAKRPFRVFVGNDEVRAVGTAFDIRMDGGRARVTLEEGVVAVYRREALEIERVQVRAAPAAVLEPGQQAIVADSSEIKILEVDTRRAGAWRFGQMVFDAEPLRSAVAEINRYNARRIVIADPSLNEMKINGVFQTGRPEAFVEALTAAFPVEVRSATDEAIHLMRRPPS